MSEDLLYTNTFITPESRELESEKARSSRVREDFRKFYESKFGKPVYRDTSSDLSTLVHKSSKSAGKFSRQGRLQQTVDSEEANAEIDTKHHQKKSKAGAMTPSNGVSQFAMSGSILRSKIVCIDSRDRDMSLFPSPASFRVFLGEKFTNVRKIRLVSTELPNTEQLIKSTPPSKKNNKLYWQNGPQEQDKDEIYSITITDGNYTAGTFANEIKTKTAAVERKLTTSTGDKVFHDFDVTVETVTNRFILRQNNSTNLDNPISTVAGSNVVTIQQDQHDFLPGQIVNISGSAKVGGIPSSALNASQVIDIDIEKVDKLFRVSNSTQKATFVIYGTTTSAISGRVIVNRGTYTVKGLGTKFLKELTPGQIVNIGFNNYTVQNVVNDTTFTVETPLLETFNEYWLIHNILTGDTAGFEPVPNDTTKTKVNVINHKLRNINYTASDYLKDQDYEAENNDLSLKNYTQMQNIINISTNDKTYSLQVTFASRDPKYESFSSFTVNSSLENFNLSNVTSALNNFAVIDQGVDIQTYTLPSGNFSPYQIQSTVASLLNNWEVSYDTTSQLFYYKPPTQNTPQTVVLSSVSINDSYIPYQTYGLDFALNNSAGPILGFPQQQVFGTIILSNFEVPANSIISFDPQYTSIFFLNGPRLAYTITLGRTSYSTITDLVELIRSTLLSRNIPIGVLYKPGMRKVMFYGTLPSYDFQIIFRKPAQPTITIGNALGFDTDLLHRNNVIVAVIPIRNYLTDARYTFALADQVSAVATYNSNQIRGWGIITNTSNIIKGAPDVFDYVDERNMSSLIYTTGSSSTVVGQISGNSYQLVTASFTYTPQAGHVCFSPSTTSAAYDPKNILVTAKDIKQYTVTMSPSGRFNFTTISGEVLNETSTLFLELGKTLVFDLSTLPTACKFKLSLTQNGEWNGGTELLSLRRYVCNGRFLQVTVPSDYAASTQLFYYDDSHGGSQTVATNTYQAVYKYVSVSTTGYLQFADPPTVVGGTLTYTLTPVLEFQIGNKYILDYTPLLEEAAAAKTPPDQLKLSLTVDGLHYFGEELANTAAYLSYGVDPVTQLSTNTIILDLNYANGPFPSRIFYYLKNNAGAGGSGFITIKYKVNCGVISLSKPFRNSYDVFLNGPVVTTLNNDTSLVLSGYTLLYAPYNGLTPYAGLSTQNLNILDDTTIDVASTLSDNYNVTLDNNRFLIFDTGSNTSQTISIGIGNRTLTDIASELQTNINALYGITDSATSWNVVYDAIINEFTFIVQNGRQYEFIFDGVDTNGVDLYNSAAELLGFVQGDIRPGNTTADATTISSTTSCNISLVQRDFIKIPTGDLQNVGLNKPLRWSEKAIQNNDLTKTAVFYHFPTIVTGSRFTRDLSVNDNIVIGEDLDQVLVVTNVIDDYNIQVNTNVTFVGATVAEDGTITAAPLTVYYQRIYKIDPDVANSFLSNEKVVFFKSPQAKSTYDYDGRLTDKNLQITRISPIKLSLVDTDALLELSLTDDGTYDYPSVRNQNLAYIKNNSKYHFTTPFPSTSSIDSRGGNPIKVGTGVKYRLLFSNVDTPGSLLGFPNVGDVIYGNTDYKTVQSNTVVKTNSLFNVIRSEPGTDAQANTLRIITESKHNYEYGDTVYIEDHKNSSNDLAVNNDEGHTITLVDSDLTFVETENGVNKVRGVFYISLVLKNGGVGGFSYKRKLYKPFALSGENYVYLTSPALASLSTTSNRVSNVFAKLLLDAPPGAILFNSYVTSDKLFDESPLPVLEYLDISVVDLNGDLFDFNNFNWSASFNVTYASQTPASAGVSSRTLERSDV